MANKVAAVLQYVDGVLTAVLGTKVEFSLNTAAEFAEKLETRRAMLVQKRAEQEAAAEKAARLAAELAEQEPEFVDDEEGFKVLLRSLKSKLTEQGVAFPDEKFREYITE